MIAVAIVNYRTADATIACLDALLAMSLAEVRVFLLDNGSGPAEQQRLTDFCVSRGDWLTFIQSERNLGFAAGTNRLLTEILADRNFEEVLLLNSDTVPTHGFIDAMHTRIDMANHVDMIAARMVDPKTGEIDNLGITLFRSTLASNRKREDEVLLGPSGGCALITRRLLADIYATHGEWFDETFFCYAEDTDFAVRTRWLGYNTAYAADAVIYHAGSLSSGGPENDFVLYHGIRNSIWWLVKNAPLGWFLRSLPWFTVLHAAIWLRHMHRGKARVLWRLYRDAIKGIPAMQRKRAIINKTRRMPSSEFSSWVEPHFYQRNYVRRAWSELFRAPPKR